MTDPFGKILAFSLDQLRLFSSSIPVAIKWEGGKTGMAVSCFHRSRCQNFPFVLPNNALQQRKPFFLLLLLLERTKNELFSFRFCVLASIFSRVAFH